MSSDEAFLADIRENLEDDTPRLVYADWLDEHGDPDRAEFIRAQCKLARMKWRDPGYSDLSSRASELLRSNRERWLGDLPKGMANHPGPLAFHRGFVDEATLPLETFFQHGHLLLDRFPIRLVHLTGKLGQTEASALAAMPALARLPGLRLGYGDDRCNKESLKVLLASPHLAGLRELHLIDYRVSQAALRVLVKAQLPGLRVLDLRSNSQIGDAGIEALVAAPFVEQLTDLDLVGTGITDAGAKTLAACSRLHNLKKLVLGGTWGGGNRVAGEGTKALVTSPFLRSLEQLDLASNPIGSEGAAALAGWSGLRRLSELNLRQCKIGGAGLAALCASPHLHGLVYLELYSNEVGPEGARALAAATHLTHLRELDLGSNKLGNAGAEALAGAPHLASLVKLSLWNNDIGSPGSAALARSPWLTELTELRLYMNKIGDAGARALAESAIWRHHQKLDMHSNEIGDDGATAISQSEALAGLTELELHFNHIGRDGALALAASPILPRKLNIDIRYNRVERKYRKDVSRAIHERFRAPKVWV